MQMTSRALSTTLPKAGWTKAEAEAFLIDLGTLLSTQDTGFTPFRVCVFERRPVTDEEGKDTGDQRVVFYIEMGVP